MRFVVWFMLTHGADDMPTLVLPEFDAVLAAHGIDATDVYDRSVAA